MRCYIAALWALVPVGIAWLMTYVVMGLTRWINADFKPECPKGASASAGRREGLYDTDC